MNETRTITIDNMTLPASYFGKLVKRAGGDYYQAGRALYRARSARNPLRYLQAGLKRGWLWEATVKETENPRVVREWIERHVLRLRPEPVEVFVPQRCGMTPTAPMSIADILSTMSGGARG